MTTEIDERSFSSFDEYKKELFPNSSEDDALECDDPIELGCALADDSLAKLDRVGRGADDQRKP